MLRTYSIYLTIFAMKRQLLFLFFLQLAFISQAVDGSNDLSFNRNKMNIGNGPSGNSFTATPHPEGKIIIRGGFLTFDGLNGFIVSNLLSTVKLQLDIEAPVADLENLLVIEAQCNVNLSDLSIPTATDEVDGTIQGTTDESIFPITTQGSSFITWTYTDASGNSSTQTQEILIADTEAPQITCPADITVTAPVAANGVEVFYDLPLASDNCEVTLLQLFSGYESGTFFTLGTTNVTYLAYDAAGNFTECSFTVTVIAGEDTEAPVFSDCPADITVFNEEGQCGAFVSWSAPTATDNSGFASLFSDFQSGSLFPPGTTTVTYTATDASGNSSICSFDVTVIYTEKPQIVGTEFYTQVNNAGTCFATLISLNIVYAYASDNCGSYEAIGVRSDGLALDDNYPVGTTIITWSFVNASGTAADDFIQTIVITDSENPVIEWPVPIEVDTDPGSCEALISIVPPAVTDNCDTNLVPVGVRSDGLALNDPYPLGFVSITWTAQDDAGNQAFAVEQYISVYDREKPVIIPPAPITLSVSPANCVSFETLPFPNATDNCSTEFTFTATQNDGIPFGTYFQFGETIVTWRAFDSNGNQSDPVDQIVTVIDDEAPSFFNCPGDILGQADPGESGKAVFYDFPIALDNCGVIDYLLIEGLSSGELFPIGTTQVTFRATDEAGNSTDCNFSVTITQDEDNEDPVISNCPADISVSNDAGSCGAVVNWTPPTATDNSGFVLLNSDFPPGTFFPIGTTAVTYTAIDAAGNTAICSFNVTISDNEKPVILFPGEIQVGNELGACEANINLNQPTVTDNCGTGIITSGIRSDGLPLSAPYPLGITTITWSAEDAAGNLADEIIQTISVLDIEAPVITCLSNISTTVNVGETGIAVNYDLPTANDNCSIPSIQLMSGPASGEVFPIGTTTVTYRAADASGNTADCSFTVTVTENADTEDPVISNCPTDISVSNDTGNCGAIVSWTEPNATDNSGFAFLNADFQPDSFFPVGTTTVTYTATDAAGNTSTCGFNVTVINTEKPQIFALENYTQVNDPGTCFATLFNIGIVTVSASDNCGSYEATGVRSDGLALDDTYPVGTTTITWSAVNASGTAADDFIQTIVITDSENPVIEWPVHLELDTDPGSCEALISIVPPAVTDNCDTNLVPVGVRSDGLAINDPYPLGFVSITWTAQDAAGNQAFAVEQFIGVYDREKPVILPPAPITLSVNGSPCQSFETVPFPSATDNCSVEFFYTGTRSDGLSLVNGYPIGETIISWVASDLNGNQSDPVDQVVTVIDDEAPSFFNCPGDILGQADPGESGKAVFYDFPIALDNCGVIDYLLIEGLSSGELFPIGTTQVTFRATDEAGNSTDCNFSVTITQDEDNEDPVISNCPADISVSNDAGSCGAVVNWTPPTATDNSGFVLLNSDFPPGTFFPIGTTAVTYTAIDAAGNTAICSFNVTISDNEKPVILFPGEIQVGNGSGACEANINLIQPSLTDNCGTGTITSGIRSDGLPLSAPYPLGITTITWSAEDAAGNLADDIIQTISVLDIEAPVITCQSNISTTVAVGETGIAVTYDLPTANDNCSIPSIQLMSGPASGEVFPIGTTTVTYRATDAEGNIADCSFTVSVTKEEDLEAPVPDIETLSPIQVQCGLNFEDLIIPTATDNVAGTVSGTTDESIFPITVPGTYQISWSYKDGEGNETIQFQTIEITGNTGNFGNVDCSFNIGQLGSIFNPNSSTIVSDIKVQEDGKLLVAGSFDIANGTNVGSLVRYLSNGTLDTEFTFLNFFGQVYVLALQEDGKILAGGNFQQVGSNQSLKGLVRLNPNGSLDVDFNSKLAFEFPFVRNIKVQKDGKILVGGTFTSSNMERTSGLIRLNSDGSLDTDFNPEINLEGTVLGLGIQSDNKIVFSFLPESETENNKLVRLNSNGSLDLSEDLAPGNFIWDLAIGNDGKIVVAGDFSSYKGETRNNIARILNNGELDHSFNPTSVFNPNNRIRRVILRRDGGMFVGGSFTSGGNGIAALNQDGSVDTRYNFGSGINGDLVTSFEQQSDGKLLVGGWYTSFDGVPSSGVTRLFAELGSVTISDNLPPVPDLGELPVILEQCSLNFNQLTIPTATDDVDGVINGVTDLGIFPIITQGRTVITWTFTDASGNSSNQTQEIIVEDTEKPLILGVGDISQAALEGSCEVIINIPVPAVNDNCSTGLLAIGTRSDGLALSAAYPLGITTITWNAEDAAGNQADPVTQTVTVTDTEAPVITCPADISTTVAFGETGAVVSYDLPTATDNCGTTSVQLISGLESGAVFPLGTTTVTYRATDASGNTADCSFTVTVTESADTEDPVISNCPADTSLSNDAGSCGAIVNWTAPTASDNSGSVNLSSNFAPGSFFPVGTTLVTYTATDPAGNTAICSFEITVSDNEKPVIFYPGVLEFNVSSSFCEAFIEFPVARATDNCDTEIVVVGTRSDGLSFSDPYPLGITIVTYSAEDAAGNRADEIIKTVTNRDFFPPMINCPADIITSVSLGETGKVVTYDLPVATDNCVIPSLLLISGPESGAVFPVGTTIVTYRATDEVGLSSECSFTVTVTENADTEDPVISNCPTDISVSNDAGSCGAIVNWTAPTASDNSGSVNLTSNFAPGSFFPVGTTLVTYTATDAAGNTATCSFEVTVSDNEKPVIFYPGVLEFNVSSSFCEAFIEFPVARATDNCDTEIVVVGTRSDGLSFSDPYPLGITIVTYSAEDAAGNRADEIIKTVTNRDFFPPMINCPADIITSVSLGETGKVVNYNLPVATDNCGSPIVQLISGPASGAVFPVGTTIVTYRATDEVGLSSECSFTVTVTQDDDNEDPVISDCPANISVSNDAGSCGAVVNWTVPTASDNSGSVNLISNFEPGAVFPVGTTTVTYTATDAAGNTATCSFEVTVNDTQAPTVLTRNVVIEIAQGASYTLTPAEVDNGSTDNCGIASRTLSKTLFTDADAGDNTVTLTVTDNSGNQGSASATVTVVVLTAPECVVARARDVVLVLDRNGNATLSANQVDNGSFSDCSNRIRTRQVDKTSFTCADLGEQMVTFRAIDANGNVGETEFKVTVVDQTAPSIGKISRISVTLNGGQTYVLPDLRLRAAATDNCSVAEYIQIPAPGTVYSTAGTYPIVLRATDQSGNIGERTVNLTIRINNNRPRRGRLEPVELNDLTVPWNTSYDGIIQLQRKQVGKKAMDELDYQFETDKYDPMAADTYVVRYHSTQARTQMGEFKVKVEEKSLPLNIGLSNNILLAELDSGSVIGRFTTLDPSDDIHIYRMEEHPEFHLEGNALIWKGEGMPPATASVKVYSTDRVGKTISREIQLFREITPNSMLIYPNPAYKETNILVNLSKASDVEIRIFDAAGRLVFSEESFHEESFVRNIDLDQLSYGLYNVVIKINNQYIQGRLVKQ
ncbi:HYR domain-containing protein [Cyclobacteriaceae bacterium YHN15]|nr:HYR domain-containing protein [Cyclobacteriaceae bacterium YHN15]